MGSSTVQPVAGAVGDAASVTGTAPGTTGLALLGDATPAAVAGHLGWEVISSPTSQTVFQSAIAGDSAGNAATSGVLHACYLGKTLVDVNIKHVRSFMTAASGSANQIMEIGLCSSPLGPQAAGQTLTCLAVAADTGTPTNITTCLATSQVKTNVADFTEIVPAGTHLWAAVRCAFTGGAGTQPTFRRCFPVGDGQVLWGAASGALVKTSTYVCAVAAIGTQPPYLFATLW